MRSKAKLLAEEKLEIDEIFEKYNKDRAKKRCGKKRRAKSKHKSKYDYIPSSNYNQMIERTKFSQRRKLDQLDELERFLQPKISPPSQMEYAKPNEDMVLDEVDAIIMSNNEVKEIVRSIKHGSKKKLVPSVPIHETTERGFTNDIRKEKKSLYNNNGKKTKKD